TGVGLFAADLGVAGRARPHHRLGVDAQAVRPALHPGRRVHQDVDLRPRLDRHLDLGGSVRRGVTGRLGRGRGAIRPHRDRERKLASGFEALDHEADQRARLHEERVHAIGAGGILATVLAVGTGAVERADVLRTVRTGDERRAEVDDGRSTDAGLEPTVRSAPIPALDVAIVAAFAAAEETIAADVVRGAGGGVEATIRVTGEDAAREGEVPAGLPGQVLAVAFLEALDGAVAAVRRLAAARVEGALG